MNFNDDEALKLAIALRIQPDPTSEVTELSVPQAPLAATIERYLREHCNLAIAPVLREIAALNQGVIDDLDTADFRSYIMSELRVSASDVENCCAVLRTYSLTISNAIGSDADVMYAARSDSDTAPRAAVLSDVVDQLRKRTK